MTRGSGQSALLWLGEVSKDVQLGRNHQSTKCLPFLTTVVAGSASTTASISSTKTLVTSIKAIGLVVTKLVATKVVVESAGLTTAEVVRGRVPVTHLDEP